MGCDPPGGTACCASVELAVRVEPRSSLHLHLHFSGCFTSAVSAAQHTDGRAAPPRGAARRLAAPGRRGKAQPAGSAPAGSRWRTALCPALASPDQHCGRCVTTTVIASPWIRGTNPPFWRQLCAARPSTAALTRDSAPLRRSGGSRSGQFRTPQFITAPASKTPNAPRGCLAPAHAGATGHALPPRGTASRLSRSKGDSVARACCLR